MTENRGKYEWHLDMITVARRRQGVDRNRRYQEGLPLMVVGEKRRFWIPEHLAYRGEREPFGMLVFDVELFAIR